MHNAPSVSYPAGRSRFAGSLLLLAWLLAMGATAAWWQQAHAYATGWRLAVAWISLGATGLFAAWNWWHAPSGTLAWDGGGWRWSRNPQAAAGFLDVSLDLQRFLLVRWTAGGASQWLWLERASRVELWQDLRRAVYSRARPEVPHTAEPSAAKP